MKKYFLLIVLFFVINVNAATCDKNELARLKNIAKNVEFETNYEIKEENGEETADFSIIAHNLNDDLKVNYEKNFLKGNYKEFVNDGTNTGKLSGFTSGQKVNITIRAYTDNGCTTKVLLQKTVNLPYLNKNYYIFTGICENYPEFKYCKPVFDREISINEFMNEFNLYNKSSETIEEVNNEKDNNNYIIFIVIGSLILLLVIIVVFAIIYKKKKRNSI